MSSRFYRHGAATAAPPAPARVPSGPGRPLPSGLRATMEPRFGHDFSRVRVHSDSESAASARALGAPAFSVGRDIMLGEGALHGDTGGRQRLIAHELAHVVQSEREGAPDGVAAAEADADRAGEQAAAGSAARVGTKAPPGQALCAPPQLEPRPPLPGIGWKPPDMTTRWYTLDGFETRSAELKPGHHDVIDEVIAALAREPLMGGFITVIGYADAIGTDPDNKALGRQRADAVRAELVAKGVSPQDVRAASLGEEVLAVDTKRAEPRNRRVEIVIRRRRMHLGPLAGPSPTPGPLGPGRARTTEPGDVGPIVPRAGSEKQAANERVKEFERRVRDIAYEQGAPRDAPFDELVKDIARKANKDMANQLADAAESAGVDRKWAKEKIEKGIEKGVEAGLKAALTAIVEAIAGPPTERPQSEYGPAEVPQEKPFILPVPLPFPGDAPKPANAHNPTLTVNNRVSANMNQTVFKQCEFISFQFTTPASFGQVRAVVEIVPAGGGTAVRSRPITGRRSGSDSLEVPETPGSYVLQVRLVDEEPHPRGTFRFSVRAMDPAEKD